MHGTVAEYDTTNTGVNVGSPDDNTKAADFVTSEAYGSGISLLQMKTDLAIAQPPGTWSKLTATSDKTYPAVQKEEDFYKDYTADGGGKPQTHSWIYVNWQAIFDHFNMKNPFVGVKMKAVFAEYLAMTLLVIVGCGSAMGVAKSPGWILQVSLTFGLAVAVLGYSVGHHSGAHINCAVTFALCLAGQVGWCQGFCILVAQLLGSITGAAVLACIYPEDKDLTGSLASNGVNEGYSVAHALSGELLMTFLLVFVVLETAVSPETAASRVVACGAIGLAVFLAHVVLVPVDGCSVNPARSFGPALVARCARGKDLHAFRHMWIFWLGPLWGAAAAVGVFSLFE